MMQGMEKNSLSRCSWCESEALYLKYHDEEWGVPAHDDRRHFEFLLLESAQAGLSWLTILRKRENYRKAYDDFSIEKAAGYGNKKIHELLSNDGIIRNRRKIESSVNNAKRIMEIQKEFGSFDSYLWAFVDNKPKVNCWKSVSEIPSKTALSDKISSDLKKRGFQFIGATVMYSHLQAVGIVNDHVVSCFRYEQLAKLL
jgi:DNA-3-methyladenine glycosylase I